MASHIKWTEKKIEQRQREGYGQGSGADYKPWIEVTDFSSKGRSRRVASAKTGRVHHLFSDVEYGLFIAAEWSRSVIDIREQYPLDREMTQTIAQQLKISHPCYPATHVPTVMTVDLLLTKLEHGHKVLVALNAKRDEEAENAHSLEKLEIQRSYFEALNIEHHLIYHSQLPELKIRNITWIRDAQLKSGELEPRPNFYAALCSSMGRELGMGMKLDAVQLGQSLTQYCQSFDERYGVEPGTGLRVAYMLMQERALMVDLDSKDLASDPLSTFVMTGRSGRLQAVGGV